MNIFGLGRIQDILEHQQVVVNMSYVNTELLHSVLFNKKKDVQITTEHNKEPTLSKNTNKIIFNLV